MTQTEALNICRNIERNKFTEEEKEEAVKVFLKTDMSKCMSRPEFVKIIAWLSGKALGKKIELQLNGKEFAKVLKDNQKKEIFNKSIDELKLTTRAYNCLKRAGITTVGDLCRRTPEDMMKVRNLGRRCLEEILEKLKELGLQLREEE